MGPRITSGSGGRGASGFRSWSARRKKPRRGRMRVAEPGCHLDSEVAEKVMGICLMPPRELAMARVAAKQVISTGSIFHLRDGSDVPMPSGETLRQPEGSDYWNDRYFLS